MAIIAPSPRAPGQGPAELAVKAAEDALATTGGRVDQLKSVGTASRLKVAKGQGRARLGGLTAAGLATRPGRRRSSRRGSEKTSTMAGGFLVGARNRSRRGRIDKGTFEEAKTGLATVKQTWADAQESFKGGKVEDAVAKATTVKDKTAEIMTKLGMQVPAAARS